MTPLCSVIIPTYNRAETLLLCLDALAAQTVPPGTLDIIVADDGSTDATGAAVAAWAARHPSIPARYFRQDNRGANAARNAAIRLSTAPLLLIINDDTLAVPTLAADHLALHAAYPDPATAVLGRMTISPLLPPSVFAALHHDAAYRAFDGRKELDWTAFFTCNLSVKRDFLLAHGLFDEDLRWHEDIELGERLVPHGLRLIYCPTALGHHHHALDEAGYFRIAAREGSALALWHLKRRAAGLPDNAIVAGAMQPALRHRVADILLNGWAEQLGHRTARLTAPHAPRLSAAIYAKLFQRRKRRALWEVMAVQPGTTAGTTESYI